MQASHLSNASTADTVRDPVARDWLWKPWYAKLWWAAIPVYWAGAAASLKLPALAEFFTSALAGYLNMLFFPLTALLAGGGVQLSFLRILRMLRVARMLRLMKAWKGLYKIITTFIRAMPQMSNLVFLILLTMFMFSLLGMQLFGGCFEPPEFAEPPRTNFDSIAFAMLTVFVIACGEG